MHVTKKIIKSTLVYIVLAFTAIISLFPIIWVIFSSFKTNAQILSSPFSLPTSIGFDAYGAVFKQTNFLLYTFNSLFIAAISTAVSLIIYAMAAYVIARYDFKGRNLIYSLFVVTLLVPSQSKAQPILSLIVKFNLYDTKTALVLVYIAAGMAMSLFILKNTFMSIPKDFSEAAWMEGSGFLRTFFSINLPMAKAGMATAGILMFLGNWNEYFFAMLLTTSPISRTLPVALASFNETYSYNYTNMFAALTMAILPGILIYAFAQDQVANSIVSSGIKG
jgi:raffinose/stachyose/melibiose transport system permease protein